MRDFAALERAKAPVGDHLLLKGPPMNQLTRILIASALIGTAGVAGAQTVATPDTMASPPSEAQPMTPATKNMNDVEKASRGTSATDAPTSATTTSGATATGATATGATPAGATAAGATAASTSADPYVQKREEDAVAKKEYKAKKKLAKAEYKHEKSAAKSDMKMKRNETKDERDTAIKGDASVKPAAPGDPAPMTK
ncbi:MAG: hypothetical protein H7244_15395 [Herminiimonas sp.]|nr:hypothetical protein [Herminiimonas sp.]